MGIVLPLLLILKNDFSATRMNFEKPPVRGGEHYLTQNSPEPARLHFHFRTRKREKGGEHSSMVSIMQEIHVLFIK